MNEPSDNSYWMQAIANIPDPKKRELAMAVWQRIQADNPDPQSTDRIYGMFLIFEANGLYLMEFPKKFHQEVTSKLEAQLGQFNNLVYASERQQNSAAEKIEKATVTLYAAHDRLDDIADKMQGIGSEIVKKADLPGLVEKLADELQVKCTHPIQSCVKRLAETCEKIEEAKTKVDKSIAFWRELNLSAIFLSSFVLCACFWGFLTWSSYSSLRHYYYQSVTEEIQRIRSSTRENNEVLSQLALWKVTLHLSTWVDSNNQPIDQGHALSLSPAKSAQVNEDCGTIFFKDQRPSREAYTFQYYLDPSYTPSR